jgi:hypothetical protein
MFANIDKHRREYRRAVSERLLPEDEPPSLHGAGEAQASRPLILVSRSQSCSSAVVFTLVVMHLAFCPLYAGNR